MPTTLLNTALIPPPPSFPHPHSQPETAAFLGNLSLTPISLLALRRSPKPTGYLNGNGYRWTQTKPLSTSPRDIQMSRNLTDLSPSVSDVVSRPGRRSVTKDVAQGIDASSSLEKILSAVALHIKESMDDQGINTRDIDRKLHRHLLLGRPGLTDDYQTRDVLSRMIWTPFTVSDDEMSSVLVMNRSTQLSVPRQHVQHIFYVRSFPLTAGDLKEILRIWNTEELIFDEMGVWAEAFGNMKDDTNIWIRYVGMAHGGKTGYMRFIEDQKELKSGLLSAFVTMLAQNFPWVLAAARVYELDNLAYTDEFISDQKLVDDRERILIAFLHKPTLLNRQGGGYLQSYRMLDKDALLFEKQRTKVFSLVARGSVEADDVLRGEVSVWAEDRETWANEHPEATFTNRFPLSLGWKQVLVEQATPITFKGHVLFVLVGKDVTFEGFQSDDIFLGTGGRPPSRAAVVVHNILVQLHALENGFSHVQPMPFVPGMFPFVDLFPCMGHKKKQLQLGGVREYFAIVKPLIAVAFSRDVCSGLYASFMHMYGLPTSGFLDVVGVPVVRYYDTEWIEDPTADGPNQETAFILIPHLHPGRDKYGNQPEELRRVFVLSWEITMVIANNVLKELSDWNGTDRARFCSDIIQNSLSTVESLQLVEELEKAKQDLLKIWQKQNSSKIPISEATKAKLKKKAETRIIRAGLAEGAPGSPERAEQTQSLWKLNYPDLHIRFSRSQRNEWMSWTNALAIGKSYYASAIAMSPSYNLDPVIYLPPGQDLQDPVVAERVFGELVGGARLRGADPERLRLHLFKRHGADTQRVKDSTYIANLQRRRVKVYGNRIVVLFWKDPAAKSVKISLRAPPSAVQSSTDDERLVVFDANGISITNSAGVPFLQANTTAIVTWTKAALDSLTDSAAVRRCWEYQTKLQWKEAHVAGGPVAGVPVAGVPVAGGPVAGVPVAGGPAAPVPHPAAFYEPLGEPPVKSGMGKARLSLYSTPPNPGEGTWIVFEMLRTVFPHGGRVFSGMIGEWPEKHREHVKILLSDFLSLPLYANYPHRDVWVAILSDNRAQSAKTIKANIEFCVPIKAEKVQKNLRGSGGKQLTGYYWSFEDNYTWLEGDE